MATGTRADVTAKLAARVLTTTENEATPTGWIGDLEYACTTSTTTRFRPAASQETERARSQSIST